MINELSQNNHNEMLLNELLLLVALFAFFILIILEVIKPYRRIHKTVKKRSMLTNTTAFVFNNVILTILRASSLFFIAQNFSHYGLLNAFENGPLKWLLSFLLFDLAMYALHVLSHKYEALWRFHKIHHSDKTVNVTTGFRFHVFDLGIEIIYKCLLVIVLGINAYLILAIELIHMIFIFFHHSNITFENEALISKFIITPDLHRTHHSILRAEHDSNYGIALAIWDSLFGTRKEVVPKELGLDLIQAENFVQLFFLAFITERSFRKLFRIIPRGK